MSKEKQIIEIKECIDSVYGADCAYFDVDGFAIANEIYNAGYRKQSDGEWLGVWDYECSACHEYHDIKTKYCPNCGAKMKGV